MKAMRKYKLELGMNTVNIPGGLCGHHIAVQPAAQGLCQLWTMADLDKPEVPAHIAIVPTGDIHPGNEGDYLGTVLLNGGALVFHALLVRELNNG